MVKLIDLRSDDYHKTMTAQYNNLNLSWCPHCGVLLAAHFI